LRQLDAVYQSAPVGLAVLDSDMRFVRVNDELAAMNGAAIDEHIGKQPAEVVPALARTAVAQVRAVLKRGESVNGVEIEVESPARPVEVAHFREHWVPLKDGDGEIVGMSIVVEDVTEEKRHEQQLRASQRYLE